MAGSTVRLVHMGREENEQGELLCLCNCPLITLDEQKMAEFPLPSCNGTLSWIVFLVASQKGLCPLRPVIDTNKYHAMFDTV